MLARACGKTNVHSLEPEDLAALTIEAAAMARVPLAGTSYIPGVTEERALDEIKTMLDRYLENPIDELPDHEAVSGSDGGRADEARAREDRTRSTPSTSRASASPTRRTSAWSRTIDLDAATPGQDINWLEDIELLEEEGTPAVFDRYSNSFLKIYFPIPEGRENEIARKVLIAHLQAGNSYGIQLKEAHASSRSPSSARGSRARARSAPTGSRPCSRAGSRRPTEMRAARSTSSSGRASTGSRRRGTSPSRARRCWSSTRPASPPARPASPAASCATTTSSPRCPS